jgi:hypothetical protein
VVLRDPSKDKGTLRLNLQFEHVQWPIYLKYAKTKRKKGTKIIDAMQ